jgi:hypothetical protein
MMPQEEVLTTEDLLSQDNFTEGQHHVIEVVAKTLDQTVTEYLTETLLEAVGNYANLERELGL